MALRLLRTAAKNLILMQENCKSIDLGKQTTLPETYTMKEKLVLLSTVSFRYSWNFEQPVGGIVALLDMVSFLRFDITGLSGSRLYICKENN